MLTLRPAVPSDAALILEYIRELAEYEREPKAAVDHLPGGRRRDQAARRNGGLRQARLNIARMPVPHAG
jgi:hypothetical protein